MTDEQSLDDFYDIYGLGSDPAGLEEWIHIMSAQGRYGAETTTEQTTESELTVKCYADLTAQAKVVSDKLLLNPDDETLKAQLISLNDRIKVVEANLY